MEQPDVATLPAASTAESEICVFGFDAGAVAVRVTAAIPVPRSRTGFEKLP
jgi:hypothetical protein